MPRRGPTQPSNTPVTRTPSCSISFDPSDVNTPWGRPSSISLTTASGVQRTRSMDSHEDDLEEERMVEDLLIPSPSTSAAPHYPFFHHQNYPSSPVSASPGAVHGMAMAGASSYEETFPIDRRHNSSTDQTNGAPDVNPHRLARFRFGFAACAGSPSAERLVRGVLQRSQ